MAGGTVSSKAVAYVASTLPIALLDKKLDEWGVAEVVLQGATHHASFAYLKQRHPALRLKVLPTGSVLNALGIAWMLMQVKLARGRIFFFHECCCPVFDIGIKLIKPAGRHYPQVTMGGFELVDSDAVELTNLQRLIRALGLENWFHYYRGDLDNKEGYFYVQTIREYPSTITRHDVAESRQMLSDACRVEVRSGGAKKIIILGGRDIVEDAELWRIYSEIIDWATAMGFECYLKDHPARHARLNLLHEDVCIIDPAMPLELVEDDFTLAIGVASTGLLHFGTRAISIIKLLPTVEEGASVRRIAHLVSMPGGRAVQFPEDLNELRGIFAKTAHT